MSTQQVELKTPVKIGLPTLVVYADRLHVNSLLLKNTTSAFPAVVVEYVEFTDEQNSVSAMILGGRDRPEQTYHYAGWKAQ